MRQFILEDFISRFEDIPEEQFTLSTDLKPLDAYEWLTEKEQEALYRIVRPWGYLTDINDGVEPYSVYGDTIKERILNFLYYIKKNKVKYNE